MYVIIEGPDRVGKTTLISNIKKELDGKIDVTAIREPGQTAQGKQIREMIMSSPEMSPAGRAFLFLADRAETFKEFKSQMTSKTHLVISDRGYISGVAYATMDDFVTRTELEWMNELAMDGVEPDLIILIKAKKETLIERTKKAGAENYFDEKGVKFMTEVQSLMLFQLYSMRDKIPFIVIKAELTEEEMFGEAIAAINNLGNKNGNN